MGKSCSQNGRRGAFKILTGPLGRPRSRWEDKIRMDLKEIGINTKNLIHSTQDKDYWETLVIAALNLRIP